MAGKNSRFETGRLFYSFIYLLAFTKESGIYSYLTSLMLKEYSISDICPKQSGHTSLHVCSLEKISRSRWVWPHTCNFYSIVWFISGRGTVAIDFAEYEILPNRLFLVAPKQIHGKVYPRNAGGYMWMFDKVVADRLGIVFFSSYADVSPDDIPLLELVIRNILRKKPDSYSEIDLLYFYSLLAGKMNGGKRYPESMNALFSEFKDLIFTDNLKIRSMGRYADTLHVSLASLNAICRNFAGSSAKQSLLDIKIAEAKRLLIYSRLNVSDIAYRLGYEDASYFARIFKKKTDLSPSAFSEKYRK